MSTSREDFDLDMTTPAPASVSNTSRVEAPEAGRLDSSVQATAPLTVDAFVVKPGAVAIRASVAFPSVEVLVVSDIWRHRTYLLLQLDISKSSGSFLAFHVQQRRLATFSVGIASQYYNRSKDTWEPLLEYSSFRLEFASPQPLAPLLHTGEHPVPVIANDVAVLLNSSSGESTAWFDPVTSRSAWLALREPGQHHRAAHAHHDGTGLRLSSTGALFALQDSLLALGLATLDDDDADAATGAAAKPDQRADPAYNALKQQMLHQRYKSAKYFDGVGEGQQVIIDDDEIEGDDDADAGIVAIAAADAAAQADAADESSSVETPVSWTLPRLGITFPFSIDNDALSINMKALAREQTLLLARRRAHGNSVAARGAQAAPIQLPAYPHDPHYEIPS